jgi:hypothetical protein
MIIKLTHPLGIKRLRDMLRFGPFAFSFEAQGTRFDIVMCTSGGIAGADEIGISDGRVLVALVNDFRSAFHFTCGGLSGGYVAEKLRLSHIADANNVAALINAVFANDVEAYLGKVCDKQYPDQVNHERGVI